MQDLESSVIIDSTPQPVPLILYFKDKTTLIPDGVIETLESMNNCKFEFCSNWPALLSRISFCDIERCPSLILIDSRLFILQSLSISEFIEMISIMQKTMHCGKNINLGVSIPMSCTLDLIDELKTANISGIMPYASQFGYKATSVALTNMMSGKAHWPTDIIDQLPKDKTKLPLVVTFRDEWNGVPRSTKQVINESSPLFTWRLCEKWRELCDIMHLKPDLILFHQSMVTKDGVSPSEFVSMMSTMIKFNRSNAKLAVIIENNCEKEFLKELQLTDIAGIVPSAQSFGPTLSIGSIEILLSGKPYWPKNIIENLVNVKKSNKSNTGIVLTDRQSQVLTLVCKRGLSNKKIASTLHISESTVKIHVSAILKEYGVRNRTQLALAANSSLKA